MTKPTKLLVCVLIPRTACFSTAIARTSQSDNQLMGLVSETFAETL